MPASNDIRKLAAILFADIAGYTALMQKDEPQSLANLRKFKQTLEEKVPAFQGQIIQFYGDGCLVIFESAVAAVECAKELQAIVQQAPAVPVRLGVHSGDIVLREGNVFGDAVNIASRVESMGIPGAVLLSETIRLQIKNKPNFELAALGSFDFKNVEEPIPVYALANEGFSIPQKGKIKGKFKEKSTKRNWVPPILLVVLLGLGWFFYESGTTQADQPLSNAIAVFPFEVRGGESIQYLGEGMVDLIATQLEELPALKSVDPHVLFSQLGTTNLNRLPLEELTEIARNLDAGKFILGTIVEINDLLRISASKYDAAGQLLTKKSVEGPKTQNLAATIDGLVRQLIADEMVEKGEELSSLAALTSSDFGSLKAYLNGEQAFRDGKYKEAYAYFGEATQLDTTFAMAWMKMVEAGIWNLDVSFEEAFTNWGVYKEEMPQKWQEYYEAYVMFGNAEKETGKAFQQLIRKYGNNREFVQGLGEYYFHLAPLFGGSKLQSKPYLQQSFELDKGTSEALMHLGELAVLENNPAVIEQLMSGINKDSEVYPALEACRLALKNQVNEETLKNLGNHAYFSEKHLYLLLQPNEYGRLDHRLLKRMLTFFPNQAIDQIANIWELGKKGKETATLKVWEQLVKQPRQGPVNYGQLFQCLPASLIVDTLFLPYESQYKRLLAATQKEESPWSIFAAIKYARMLQKSEEAEQLENKLTQLRNDPNLGRAANYFHYSLQAFYAYQANQGELALTMIDSAYQHAYGFYEMQANVDKVIMSGLIAAKKGDYDKAINWYENFTQFIGGDFVQNLGMELLIPYVDWRLSQWYELNGNEEKALVKSNYLLENLANCDPKYQPWYEDAAKRKARLLKIKG